MKQDEQGDLVTSAREEVERARAELASMGHRLERTTAQRDRCDCVLDGVLATVHEMVILTDSDLHIEAMSTAAMRASGWTLDEASGKPLRTVADRIGIGELTDSAARAVSDDAGSDHLTAGGWELHIRVTEDRDTVVIVGDRVTAGAAP